MGKLLGVALWLSGAMMLAYAAPTEFLFSIEKSATGGKGYCIAVGVCAAPKSTSASNAVIILTPPAVAPERPNIAPKPVSIKAELRRALQPARAVERTT